MTLKKRAKRAVQTLLRQVGQATSGPLKRFGYELTPSPTVIVRRPWETDETFLSLMREIDGHTLVDPIRCFMLYQLARQARTLDGAVAEVGVYRGGTGRLLSQVFTGAKTVHLFDTFEGMPDPDPKRDPYVKGFLSDTSVAAVRAYLADRDNVVLHPGWFPETAASLQGERFAFVHVDADIYQSTLDACRFFFPKMVAGGVMVFDDYGNCLGATQAIDEFFAHGREVPCVLPSGQCAVFKLPGAAA